MPSHLSIQEIRALPKVDLHRHLDCSMRWSTMLEIATTLKLDFPADAPSQSKYFLVTEPMQDLGAVLNKFLIAQKLLASEEILERLAFEACEDAFNDGVRILELRYAPTFIARGLAGSATGDLTDSASHLTFEKIHQAICKGITTAQKKFPMAVGLICILQRILDFKTTSRVTDFAIEHKDTLLAIDLADNEEGFEPRPFASLFEKARKAGLHVTIHTGESPSPQTGQWLRDSIEVLGADRIGHGVQAIHFPDIIVLLKKKNIALEICPYSNYLTQAFKTYESHPLRKLYDLGIAITLNSDDPGMFGSTLSDDYWIAQQYHDFQISDFKKINQNAYQHSFISEKEKSRVWKM